MFPARNLHLWLGFSMAMLVITRWYIPRIPKKVLWAHPISWDLSPRGPRFEDPKRSELCVRSAHGMLVAKGLDPAGETHGQ